MLGRPHEVRGVVAHGDARGREIGFPTANVLVSEEILLPSDGIYAGIKRQPNGHDHRIVGHQTTRRSRIARCMVRRDRLGLKK